MKPGTIIRQRGNQQPLDRLVLGPAPGPGLLLVWEAGVTMVVHGWAHDVVTQATAESERSARTLAALPAVQVAAFHWLFGKKFPP